MNNGYNGIYDDINEYVGHLTAAAQADFRRWDGQPVPDGGAAVADNRDMQDRKNGVVGKLKAKTEWLKQIFGDYSANPSAAEPERDNTPAAALPDYLQSGVENVSTDFGDTDCPAEYFDLTGRRVENPAKGSIVIERRGASARTVRF